MRLQSWAQLNSNEQQRPVITLKAHLSWNKPHFKCLVAAGGQWLPEWTVGLRPPPCSPPKAVDGVGTGSARLVTLLRGGEQMAIKPFTIRELALGLPLHVSTRACQPLDPSTRRLHPLPPTVSVPSLLGCLPFLLSREPSIFYSTFASITCDSKTHFSGPFY